MKANLYINYYVDKDPDRQRELDDCIYHNLVNDEIDKIIVILSENHVPSIVNLVNTRVPDYAHEKIQLVKSEIRPTYTDFFILSEKYSAPDDLSIIANTDIFFDNTISKAKTWHWNANYCMILCRWDITETRNINDAPFHNHPDSQDVWMVKGPFKKIPVNYGLGVAGCDNTIAHTLSEHYKIIAPAIDIKTYHLHLTNIRNYINFSHVERLPPPYFTIWPTTLS